MNNSATPFEAICEVPMDRVTHTFRSKDTYRKVVESETRCSAILNELKCHFPEYCTFGVVGGHTFDPCYDSNEIDLVLFTENLDQLRHLQQIALSLPTALPSPYIEKLWPLTIRSERFGIIDFFFHPEILPHPLSLNISHANIRKYHYEFDVVIQDDSMSILPLPTWRLADGKFLLSVDTSMRGRLGRNLRVTGVGLLCEPLRGTEFVVLQDSSNIATF
jgi:hypothetical protein